MFTLFGRVSLGLGYNGLGYKLTLRVAYQRCYWARFYLT